jgi:hypothetical protein
MFVEQSSASSHTRLISHVGQSPPQSTSVSDPFLTLSEQDSGGGGVALSVDDPPSVGVPLSGLDVELSLCTPPSEVLPPSPGEGLLVSGPRTGSVSNPNRTQLDDSGITREQITKMFRNLWDA